MSTANKNHITVFMAAFNAAPYIAQSIQSVLNQTYSNFELLIVDDGSTDNTVDIINSFQDKRIRLIQNPVNKGLPYTRNIALDEAKGEFIAILDSDDISFPNRLQAQINYFQEHPKLAVLGGYAYIIDKDGERTSNVLTPITDSNSLRAILLFVNSFTHSTVMMRTAAFRSIGGYPNYPVAQDYGLFSRLALQYEVANLPEYLSEYRIHNSNITDRKKHLSKMQLKSILFEQLNKLLPNTKHINADLLLSPINNSPYSLNEYFKVYQEIILQNRIRLQYPITELEQILHQNWFALVMEKGKSQTLKFYLKEPIFNRKYSNRKQIKRALIQSLKSFFGFQNKRRTIN